MGKYICETEITNSGKGVFYNIYPKYEIKKDSIRKVEKNEFPEGGGFILFGFDSLDRVQDYFEEKRNICIISFEKEELDDNIDKTGNLCKTNKRIKTEKLNNKISPINEEQVYQLVKPISYDFEKEIGFFDKIKIKTPVIHKECEVYLEVKDYIYGPFLPDQSLSYISAYSNDYIVNQYLVSDIPIFQMENEIWTASFIRLKDVYKSQQLVDLIPQKLLISRFKEYIKESIGTKKSISIDDIDLFTQSMDSSTLLDSKFKERTQYLEVSNERIEKIKNIVLSYLSQEEKFNEISQIIIDTILNKNEEEYELFVKKILENDEFSRKIQSIKVVKEEADTIKEEVKRKQEQLRKIEEDIKSYDEEKTKELIETYHKEIENKKFELEKVKNKVEETESKFKKLKEIYCKYKTLDEIKKERDYQEKRAKEFQDSKEKIKKEIEELEKTFDTMLCNISQKMTNIAFDGMISNKMFQAASNWQLKDNSQKYQNMADTSIALGQKEPMERKELIEYLVKGIQSKREYSHNDIINIMICITQGFLTVFAGKPGVGKTSICNIIGSLLGLNQVGELAEETRYIDISVEKGWTSKHDFIGYYNPLTKTFDKSNRLLFSAFHLLDIERENSSLPFFILLDEANLSPMEHYWADFMNICDLNLEKDRVINLGENYIFHIPKTLRFLATINYDHTTEPLSPRLLDRAWIITLPDQLKDIEDKEFPVQLISWKELEQTFMIPCEELKEGVSDNLKKELNIIYEMFKEQKINISARTKIMIQNYLNVGVTLFQAEEDRTDKKFIALDYAVSQKILTKIEGSGEKYKLFLENLKSYCGTNNMMISKNILEEILEKGEENMLYFNFFN